MEHEPQLILPDEGWTIPPEELVKLAKALAASMRRRRKPLYRPDPDPDGWISRPRYA